MSTEREKMLAGRPYDPLDAELVAGRERARELCLALNQTRPSELDQRRRLCGELFAGGGDSVFIEPPFFCDYGANIHLGAHVFFNFNCVLLDVCQISVGEHTLFGPGVQVLTPLHPLNARARRTVEHGAPVEIGADVWIGGGALILAGVHIGAGTVIGAGSVVTRDLPAGVLAVGNPCGVVREVEE